MDPHPFDPSRDVASQRLRLAEEVLEEHRAILQAIYDTVPNGVVLLDPEGRITAFNRAAEAMTGRVYEEVLGQDGLAVLGIGGEMRRLLQTAARRKATLADLDLTVDTPMGKRILRLQVAPVLERSGRAEGTVLTFTDVTQLKEYEETIRSNHDRLVTLLSRLIELRGPHLRGHGERVSRYADRLAEGIGLPDPQREELRYAALLHDLGLIALPDPIWTKEILTPYEWSLIHRHPVDGERLLDRLEGFQGIRILIRHHHEFYNGRGYPDRLAQESIPLGSRIIAIAEAYDAMTRARLDKRPLDRGVVIKEFLDNRGRQFDPTLTDILVGYLRSDDPHFGV